MHLGLCCHESPNVIDCVGPSKPPQDVAPGYHDAIIATMVYFVQSYL